jgi:hypothetical protein
MTALERNATGDDDDVLKGIIILRGCKNIIIIIMQLCTPIQTGRNYLR